MHDTFPSIHVWELKDSNMEYDFTWRIIKRENPYRVSLPRCNLSLTQKLCLLCQLAQKRSELVSRYHHEYKFFATKKRNLSRY